MCFALLTQQNSVRKILNTRIFNDDSNGRSWDKSAKELGYDVLCGTFPDLPRHPAHHLAVSQFTLHAQLKGNKPEFRQAMKTEQAKATYDEFLAKMRRDYHPDRIKGTIAAARRRRRSFLLSFADGVFGAMMQVAIQNDGPVTLIFDSKTRGIDGSSSTDSLAK